MLRYLLASTGEISTSDVDLAQASGGLILGFNVSPSEAVMVRAGGGGCGWLCVGGWGGVGWGGGG